MGCCLSTSTFKSNKSGGRPPQPLPDDRSPPPPPPPLEEETVKEVLSETPIPMTPTPVLLVNQNATATSANDVKMIISVKPPEEFGSELSEASELQSFAGSFSTSTLTDKREDDREVCQRVLDSSPAKIRRRSPRSSSPVGSPERPPVRSPVRRSAPSSGNKAAVVVSTSSAQGRTATTQKRNAGPPKRVRSDHGECSGRRSRSPATRRELAVRTTARYESGGRSEIPSDPIGDGSAVMTTAVDEGWTRLEKPSDVVLRETGESLDNPFVSLECFIFI